MQISDIINMNIVVHCSTEKEAKQFLLLCENADMTWFDGERATNNTRWYQYQESTCYRIVNKHITYGEVSLYHAVKFTIVDCEQILENENAREAIIKEILTAIHYCNCETEILKCLQKLNDQN